MNSIRIGCLALIAFYAVPFSTQASTVYVGQADINNATLVNALGVSTGESIVEGCFVDTSSAVSYYSFPISGDLSNMPLHFAVQVPGGVLPPGSTWLANPADIILQSGSSFSSIDLPDDPYGATQPVSGVFPITHTLPASATAVTNVLIRAEFFGGTAPESCIVAVTVPEPTFGITVLALAAFGIRRRRR